jgi:serine/threonine-protein kinase
VPVTELIGQIVGGKYLLEEFIGEGGMAVVYRATHVNMERPVVVKILQGRLTASEKSVQRFERECKVTAKVSHPNVVSVFDVGFINGNQPYLVMEFIKGESLRDKIDHEGPLPLSAGAAILIQICRGLQEAHSMGIIHRDLKPENILMQERSDRPDWVKIVDFGIAHLSTGAMQRLTKTGSVVGTAEYMAPEQLRDFPLDTRSDLYSLGVILFEMLTATVPFEAETLEAMLLKAIMDPPDPPSKYRQDVQPGSAFDRVVLKAMEKDPDKRYQTATEMRLEVEQIYNQLMLYRRA